MKIKNATEYEGLLKVAEALVELDPNIGTDEEKYLSILGKKIMAYEDKYYSSKRSWPVY